MSFELAARDCFKEAAKKAAPILLEPIMAVVVFSPINYVGDVIGDLNRRRGMIQQQIVSGMSAEISAMVPLKEMFGYATALRSASQGRATFTMEFDHYDTAPKHILAALQGE